MQSMTNTQESSPTTAEWLASVLGVLEEVANHPDEYAPITLTELVKSCSVALPSSAIAMMDSYLVGEMIDLQIDAILDTAERREAAALCEEERASWDAPIPYTLTAEAETEADVFVLDIDGDDITVYFLL